MQNVSLQKKIWSLLQSNFKEARTVYQSELIANYMRNHFVKPLYSEIDDSLIGQFIEHIELHEWQPQSRIYKENERVHRYYFLLEGSASIVKGNEDGEFINNLAAPSVIGQYFIHTMSPSPLHSPSSFQQTSMSPHIRSSSAVAVLPSKGFSVSAEFFNTYFSFLLQQYSRLQNQIGSEFLSTDQLQFNRIELYNFSVVEKFPLNYNLSATNKNIYIIIEGQCILYNSERKKMMTLPQMSPQNRVTKTPIFKLCKYDVINLPYYFGLKAHNLNPSIITQQEYYYTVVSSEIKLLSIPFANICEFPCELQAKLSQLIVSHNRHVQSHRSSPNTQRYHSFVSSIKEKQILIMQNAKILKAKNQISNDTILSIRKHYCLGLKDTEIQYIAPLKRKVITQMPTGYFKSKKKQKKQVRIQLPHRQWISYVKLPKIDQKKEFIINKKVKI